MTGAILQLAAKGAQDTFLVGKSEITFFKTVYRRHTNFSIETIEQIFDNEVKFGQRIRCLIDRKGDLLSNLYLKIKLGELEQDCSNSVHSFWINSIGHALIKSMDIKIGGLLIDRQYGEWLEIWGELTQKEEKRTGYFEMIGKTSDGLSTINRDKFKGPLQLYVPLNFWFCKNIGLSLPLIALQYHDVELFVEIRPFDECYITNDGSKLTQKNSYLSMSLLTDYIFLDAEERKSFAQKEHEYLIEQIQHSTHFSFSTASGQTNIPINFNHPIKELIWILKRTDIGEYKVDPCACNNIISYGNDWFNFSDKVGVIHGFDDTFEDAVLLLNGSQRFSKMDADYFRLVQTYVRHSRIPSKQIYIYSFALRPEEYQPTGTCNYSRIDNSTLNLTFHSCNDIKYTAEIYGVNYNVLRIKGGMAGIAYSN